MTTPADTAPAPTPDAPPTETAPPSADTAPVDHAAEAEKWKALAQKHEQRAKANATAATELEKFKQQSMTDAERAVAEAEKRGAQQAAQQWSHRLVKSDFIAAASKRNPEFDASAVLDDLNLSRFVGEDGEPDAKAIAAAVERLVPAPNGMPSFDGGTRTPAPSSGSDMTALIRKATGRA